MKDRKFSKGDEVTFVCNFGSKTLVGTFKSYDNDNMGFVETEMHSPESPTRKYVCTIKAYIKSMKRVYPNSVKLLKGE